MGNKNIIKTTGTSEKPQRIYKATGTTQTYKQALFIANYKKNKGNGTQAIIDAGYKVNNKNTAGVMATENLGKPNIAQEISPADIVRAATNILKKETIKNVNKLIDLRDNAKNEVVKRQATDSMLDRAGLIPIHKIQSVNVNIDNAMLSQLCKALKNTRANKSVFVE